MNSEIIDNLLERFFFDEIVKKLKKVKFRSEQLLKGIKVEYDEHCKNLNISEESRNALATYIALCHLEEHDDYYDKLEEAKL